MLFNYPDYNYVWCPTYSGRSYWRIYYGCLSRSTNNLSIIFQRGMNEMDHKIYFANETNYWWFKSRRNFLKKILKSIPNKETKTVLEVGCGTGGNLKYLFNDFKFASGIDNSLNALSIINKFNLDVKVKFGDANKLNVIKEKYDLIAFLDVLYHEDIINVEKVINQTRHCLNDNGFILISEPALLIF